MIAGRSCPLHYRYQPEEVGSSVPLDAEVLYVVGGLYGNLEALDALESLVRLETAMARDVRVVFNGDFHWFDADPAWFAAVNRRVLAHHATTGNVEMEVAAPASGAGCGCAYPEDVDDGVVERSNRIMQALQQAAAQAPEDLPRLRALPRHALVRVAGRRVAVLHGDPESVAGWGLSAESLAQVSGRERLSGWFRRLDVEVIASTHTCTAVSLRQDVDGHPRVLANNGAAGMPNFRGDLRGLVTRISAAPPPAAVCFGTRLGGLRVDAVPLAYDNAGWLRRFLAGWPAGSPAFESYCNRITHGPAHTIAAATRRLGPRPASGG